MYLSAVRSTKRQQWEKNTLHSEVGEDFTNRLQAIGIDYIFPPVVIEGWGLGWGLKTVFMKGRIQALEGKILGQGAHRHQRGNTQGLAFSVCLGLALSIFDLCNNLGGFVLSFLKSAVNFFFREKNMVE